MFYLECQLKLKSIIHIQENDLILILDSSGIKKKKKSPAECFIKAGVLNKVTGDFQAAAHSSELLMVN